jgi:hypothetical protein
MWCDGQAEKDGEYLCAWFLGEWLYLIQKRKEGKWQMPCMPEDPEYWQEIESPDQQNKMLDELHKNK